MLLSFEVICDFRKLWNCIENALEFWQVALVPGKRLDYQVNGSTEEEEAGFVTLVRYTPDAPAGKATALFNTSSGAMEVRIDIGVCLILSFPLSCVVKCFC